MRNRKKIAIVAHNVIKKGDGQGRANYEFVNYLLKKGYIIHLYANRLEPELLSTNIIFHPIRVIPKPLILKTPMFLIIATLKLFWKKYDIIYIDSGTYLGNYNFIACHFCHTRYLKYTTNFYHKIYETFNSWIERLEYKRKGTIIAVSKTLKKELMEELYIQPERIKVIYNGIDPLEFKFTPHLQNSKTTFLYLGDLSYRKGLDFLISAMRGMNKNVELFIAGKPRNKYKRLAKGLQIKFLGFVSNIAEVLKETDCLICPSLYEPFGIAVLEAMIAGVPAIVSSHAGVSELIKNMENGIILNDPKDVKEIKEKILLLAENKELRESIAKRAKETAQKYSWEKTVKEIETLFR